MGGLIQEIYTLPRLQNTSPSAQIFYHLCFWRFGQQSFGNKFAYSRWARKNNLWRTTLGIRGGRDFWPIADLKAKIPHFQLPLVSPFRYSTFEHRVVAFDKILPCWAPTRSKISSPNPQGSVPKPSAEDNLWQICGHLDSKGLCHHFMRACGNPPVSCTEHGDFSFINILANFVPRPYRNLAKKAPLLLLWRADPPNLLRADNLSGQFW
ncbi:uncharacterized protein VP01_1827g2 [Puccinia sorghi]|uniref:Uncharacterized protein n=1 Tax=Puccinia sorghi TaxID=27349 RepID=A0A0L6VEH5_9BASI|nr:uncharacterized protein VP01_1827g2 [Puccinia sorghi]